MTPTTTCAMCSCHTSPDPINGTQRMSNRKWQSHHDKYVCEKYATKQPCLWSDKGCMNKGKLTDLIWNTRCLQTAVLWQMVTWCLAIQKWHVMWGEKGGGGGGGGGGRGREMLSRMLVIGQMFTWDNIWIQASVSILMAYQVYIRHNPARYSEGQFKYLVMVKYCD